MEVRTIDEKRYLTEEEFSKFAAEVSDEGYRLFYTFLMYTGLRRGEALGLQIKDIDYEKKVAHITKSFNKCENALTTPKNQSSVRSIPLCQKAYDCAVKLKDMYCSGYLFGGDEFGLSFGKHFNHALQTFYDAMEPLMKHRQEITKLCCGPRVTEPEVLDRLYENLAYILAGHEGVEVASRRNPPQTEKKDYVYKRKKPHPEDKHVDGEAPRRRLSMDYAGIVVEYFAD